MTRAAAAVLFVLALGLSGCTPARSVLEGARFPDDEGVVTQISLERLELEGERRFTIVPRVESFKTRSHEPAALLGLKGRYVQVGLNDDREVEWIASVGVVVRNRVVYTGVYDRIDDDRRRVVFADGTTLRLGDGVDTGEREQGAEFVATIDARTDQVLSLEPANARG